ncbi:MAG: cohesin domain-containing protein [Acutalibacteraceae bacterium]
MFKSKLKAGICVILSLLLLISPLGVSAEEDYSQGHITIDTVSALNGDSVILKIAIDNNPGIMAMTISITYDSSALTYERYYFGYLNDHTVVNHPDKNLIRFVNCESRDYDNNGTIISVQFKVKEDADFGFYPVSIDYKAGDFCNWKLEKLMPVITPGGVNVAYNGSNCSHKQYGDWEVVANPTCTEKGAKQRSCIKCGHVDIGEIPAAGHDFEEQWTVDRQATAEASGIMSRHCKNCEETTDVLTFSLPESEELEIENSEGASVKPSDTTDKLMKDQLPEVYESNGGSSISKDNNNGNASDGDNKAPEINILEEIKENGDGPLSKILNALPDLKWLKIVFISTLMLFSKLILL